METKPYSLQSPEQIAKDYGGNKQKIAEAMQMGIIDPTAGTLAGMFIDRMRQAAMSEAAPQQTVAEQVFAPPMPPMPQGMPAMPAGLGATPEAAAMAPPMPAPAPAPAPDMPVPGMAMGGIAALDVPDDMFDEPSDGGFATGGLVAFGSGGSARRDMSDLYDDVEYWESGGKQSAVSPKGARGVMQLMPGTIRDPGFGVTPLAERLRAGLSEEQANREMGRDYLDAMYRRYGDKATALAAYNWGPGNVDKWLKSGADPKKLPAETRKYISNVMSNEGELAPAAQTKGNTLYGFNTDLQGNIDLLTSMAPEEAPEQLEYREDLKQRLSPEGRAEAKKDAFYAGLAKFAERLGKSTSPTFLGGLAESVGAGAGDLSASLKAAEDEARDMQREYVGLANTSRKERMELMRMGVDVTGNMARLAEGIEARREDAAIKREQLKLQRDQLNAEIEAAKAKGMDVEQMVFQMFLKGGPLKDAAMEWIKANKSSGKTDSTNAGDLRARVEAGKGGKEGDGGYKYLGTE